MAGLVEPETVALSSSTTIKSTKYQETSSLVSYAGTWAKATSSGYSGGAVRYSKSAGASATVRFTGYSVAWYGPKGPTRGKVKVYIGGRYAKTVDLYSSSFLASRALFSLTYTTQMTRELKIVVLGTAGRPTVAVDYFVVKRKVTGVVASPPPPPPPPPPTGAYPADSRLRYLATPVVGRPGYLSPIVDPTLGTTTVRVSNTAGVRHAYSRISAWNCDGSKILLGFQFPGRMLDGQTYRDLGSFAQISEAIWSNIDPNTLYGASGNAFFRQSATTGAITKLRTFTSFASITIGDYEGGISDDDRYVALIGTTSTGARHLVTYDVAANTVVADTLVSSRINNAQISRKGNYVVVVNDVDGTAIGQGTERYTRDLSSRINLYRYGRHGDNALDAAGNEIFVANATGGGVKSYRLSDGAGTVLLPDGSAFGYGHVSGRNIHRPGWIYLSVFDNSITAGTPGHDQVIAVKTDGSGIVEVFGFSHHTNATVYEMQPQAVPSPDGTRVLFASEWGTTSVLAYVATR